MSRPTSTFALVAACAALAVPATAQISPVDSARVGFVAPTAPRQTTFQLATIDSSGARVLKGEAISLWEFGADSCGTAEVDPGIFSPLGPLSDPDPGIVIEPSGGVNPHIVLMKPPGATCWNAPLQRDGAPQK